MPPEPRLLLVDNQRSRPPLALRRALDERGAGWVEVRYDALGGAAGERYDGVVLSGTGVSPHDAPQLYDDEMTLVRTTPRPLLAICGGFQVVCLAYGGELAPVEPIYGRTPVERSADDEIFAGLPRRFTAFSKHRFGVRSAGDELTPLATHASGLVYAARHPRRPLWGVQFHPERRQQGARVLDNFLAAVCQDHRREAS